MEPDTIEALKNVDEDYKFVQCLKVDCRRSNSRVLHDQLDDSLHLGSSGLEIFGAVKKTIIEYRNSVVDILGPSPNNEIDAVIAFVDYAYGRD